MPLIAEAVDTGILRVSETARRFILDYRDALNAGDFTDIKNRPGFDAAAAELRDLFANGLLCTELKELLYTLGVFGCARAKRVKAIAAIFGISDDDLEDCLGEPEDPDGPTLYYLPPETQPPTDDPDPAGTCFDDPAAPPGQCDEELEFHMEAPEEPQACAPSGVTRVSNPDDALCPTDTGQGCGNDNPEDTADLPQPPDCEAGTAALWAMTDIAFPEGRAKTLLSPRTYLDMIYKAIALREIAQQHNCANLDEAAGGFLAGLWNTIPPQYISRTLLPDWWPEQRLGPDLWDDLLKKTPIAARPGIIEKRTVITPDGTVVEYSATGDATIITSPEIPTPAQPPQTEDRPLTEDEYADQYVQDISEIIDSTIDLGGTLLSDITEYGISRNEAAPWIEMLTEAINNAYNIQDDERARRLEDIRRQVTEAAAAFTGDPIRPTPPELEPPGRME